ncbi:unnamed protein product [Staurois parvus]|uniref:Uncharacterized protein n=1 Tax=Staurois parvus TaxID=386267 RepID=A0ABN9F6Z1_9NEOB|nr:unnamed protein product [Staurois parvus]
MGDQSRRMVRQSQGSEQENGQTKPGIRAGSATNQTGTGPETGMQEQDTGPRRNKHTKGKACRSGHHLNTPA